MDADLKEFLEKIAGSLENRIDRVRSELHSEVATLRTEMVAMEDRLTDRIDTVASLAKDASRTLRTRDFRILVLEERVNEVEKRLLDVEGQKPE